MKILQFIPILGKGGAERVVVDLTNQAANDGHEVSLAAWTPAPPELMSHLLRPDIPVRYLDEQRGAVWRAYMRLLPWVFSNREWLLSHDVIHCHLSMGSAFAAYVQLLRGLHGRRTPAVVETYHAVGGAIPELDRALHARLLSRRDAVAFVAEDPYWARYRERRSRRLFRTIPNGISDPGPIDRAVSQRYRRNVARIPEDALVVGSVGRLVPERRPDLLLETFVRLAERSDRNVHLLLAGEGPMRVQLEETARAAGLENRVHMPGLILNPVDAFGTIDLYLTVNSGAITGIAALEAAWTGVPVAAVQLDTGYRRTESDWIWSSAEPQKLAAHVASLLEDETERGRIAEKQSALAKARYSVESMASANYALYNDVLSQRDNSKRLAASPTSD